MESVLNLPILEGSKVSLVLAHPGHEFRLLEWIRRHRPQIHIMTYGSRGGNSTERISASRKLAQQLEASPGALFGVASDREFYQSVLLSDFDFFDTLTRRLAGSLIDQRADAVVADRWQDYNPIHDLTHAVARAAVHLAASRLDEDISFFDYAVVADDQSVCVQAEACRINLTPVECARKMAAMNAFPDIADDIDALVGQLGRGAISVEILNVAAPHAGLGPRAIAAWYETYGAERVRTGIYKEVLTGAHVSRIAEHLARTFGLAELT